MRRIVFGFVIAAVSVLTAAAQSQVKKETVPGITNLARLETTVACAGAVASHRSRNREMGFGSIINLRLANEQGADIEGETAAAKTAGINFVHLPLNGAMPDPAVVDQFLKVVTAPESARLHPLRQRKPCCGHVDDQTGAGQTSGTMIGLSKRLTSWERSARP